ncbi:MAG: hypothetical protein U9O24_02950 [Campylobacterota bacterium]|nr:hypothetical protein [Campylobacterota bacterium]
MKAVKVVKSCKVKVKPFILKDFILKDFITDTKENRPSKYVTKKTLKIFAKKLGLSYDESQIDFTKKLMNAYYEEEISKR